MNDRQSSDPIRPTRRAFVHGTSAAVIAGSVTSLVAPVHAAGTDTLKLALVGCGNRGTGAAAQALQTTAPVKLVAMADAFRDRLEGSLAILQNGGNVPTGPVPASISARVDVPQDRQFVRLDAYRHAIDAADVVLLCGPPGFRPAQFEYAVERGKHVFMEKPVATDAPGVRRVLAAGKVAESKGLKIGVGLQRHHEAKYQETIHRLRDGAIGDVRVFALFLERRHDQTADRSRRTDRDGVPGAQLVFLRVAERRSHRRAARPQSRRLQLVDGRASDRGGRHGRPADAHRQELRRHLRPSRRRIHLSQRHEDVWLLPADAGLRAVDRRVCRGRGGDADLGDGAHSRD